MKEKIIITGISGFVGQNLSTYLTAHSKTIIPFPIRYQPNQILKLEGDVVIHLAGKAHDLKKVAQPSEFYEANFELTKQIFDVFLISEAKVFIFMSTVKAVADVVTDVLTEDTIAYPQTHYGKSKYMAEKYILSYELPENKRVYILRPCMIYGPGNKGNLNVLYKMVSKRFPWPLGAFDNKRSFLSIENLCFVVNEILEREDIESGVYQVADDEALSTNEIIIIMTETIGKNTILLKIPKRWIKFLARVGDKLHLPLNSERLRKLTENYVVSNNKLVKALNKVLPVQAGQGIRATIKSFKNVH